MMKPKLENDNYELVFQVNGKVRGKMEVAKETSKQEMENLLKKTKTLKSLSKAKK